MTNLILIFASGYKKEREEFNMTTVNLNNVLEILHKYGEYIFVTDNKKYSDMVNEISNLKSVSLVNQKVKKRKEVI